MSKRSVWRRIRKLTNTHSNVKIVFVKGEQEPELKGEGFHYTTRTGIPVRYPTAYAKVGWSSLVYHPSTLRLEVGMDWLDLYGTTEEKQECQNWLANEAAIRLLR